jgi:hypothetical protein
MVSTIPISETLRDWEVEKKSLGVISSRKNKLFLRAAGYGLLV